MKLLPRLAVHNEESERKALCWNGKHRVAVEDVPEPKIADAGDAIIRVTSTAICGSDLHLYDGIVQTLKEGDVSGHEPPFDLVAGGRIDPSFVITHELPLKSAPAAPTAS